MLAVMQSNRVNKDHIDVIMWNLQNMGRLNVYPKPGQGDDELRVMLKSALNID